MPPIVLTEEEKARLKQERLARAYRDLFGDDPRTRSETQRLVWEDLQKVGYARSSLYIPDRNGAVCPIRAAIAEGRRTVLLYIKSNVNFVPEAPHQTEEKTKIRRKPNA